MEKKKIEINYFESSSYSELDEIQIILIQKAKEIRKNAYAKYSEFLVGAAVLLDSGEIICGTNQENAAYPSGLCAERVAIFFAKSQFPNSIVKQIAICAGKDEINQIIPPCGSCRQVLSEYENNQSIPIKVILIGKDENVTLIDSVLDLVPFSFNAKMLG